MRQDTVICIHEINHDLRCLMVSLRDWNPQNTIWLYFSLLPPGLLEEITSSGSSYLVASVNLDAQQAQDLFFENFFVVR